LENWEDATHTLGAAPPDEDEDHDDVSRAARERDVGPEPKIRTSYLRCFEGREGEVAEVGSGGVERRGGRRKGRCTQSVPPLKVDAGRRSADMSSNFASIG